MNQEQLLFSLASSRVTVILLHTSFHMSNAYVSNGGQRGIIRHTKSYIYTEVDLGKIRSLINFRYCISGEFDNIK